MEMEVKAGEIYRHFKGNRYEIVCLAQDAEDGSMQVVYKALYPPFPIFVRPYPDFIEVLDKNKYPSATQVHRFEKESGSSGNIGLANPDVKNEETTNVVRKNDEPAPVVVKLESPNEEKEKTHYEAFSKPLDEPIGMEGKINPMLLRFLNCDEHDAKIAVLKEMRGKITEEMFAVMYMSMDVPMPDKSKDERYEILLKRLETLNEFDGKRFRKG